MTALGVAKGMLALGAGTAAIVYGGVLGPESGDGDQLAAVVAAAAMANIGANFVSTALDDGLRSGFDDVARRLRQSFAEGGLPENHDLVRALRESQLDGLLHIVVAHKDQARADPMNFDMVRVERFTDLAMAWIKRARRELSRPVFLESVSVEAAIGEVTGLIQTAGANETGESLRRLSLCAIAEMRTEISSHLAAKNMDWLQSFEDLFADANSGWLVAARAFFAERLKRDDRVRTVVFLRRLNELAGAGCDHAARLARVLDAVVRLEANLAERFDALEARLASIEVNQAAMRAELIQIYRDLLARLAEGGSTEAMIGALRSAYPKPLEWSQTSKQVRDRIAGLTRTFIGRRKEVAALDKMVDADLGFALVTAPAGGGKSAFLAHWAAHRRERGDIVVRHFISALYDKTVSVQNVLGHLLVQIYEADQTDYGPMPADAEQLGQRLHAALAVRASDAKRLVVLLDGLDEAASLIEPFIEPMLAANVFVVVSGRAEPNARPHYLSGWRDRLERGGEAFGQALALGPLEVADVVAWLGEAVGEVPPAQARRLGARLHKSTDGVPLFLKYVIEDLEPLVFNTDGAGIALAQSLPAPFSKYVREQVNDLERRMGGAWTASVKTLLTLLTQIMGPIAEDDIEDFFVVCRKLDPRFPEGPTLVAFDQKVERWLSVRVVDGRRYFAYAHPRLATAFAEALGARAAEQARLGVEAWLVAKPVDDETCEYALDWRVAHALRDGRQAKAAEVLTQSGFYAASLADDPKGGRRLRRAIDQWSSLELDVRRAADNGSAWGCFWAENETALHKGLALARRSNVSGAELVMRSLADRMLTEASERPVLRACNPHPLIDVAPLRMHERAHPGGVLGACADGTNGFVTWGVDRSIRFWDWSGAPRRQFRDAHERTQGVLALGGEYVSWGRDDYDLIWWDESGERVDCFARVGVEGAQVLGALVHGAGFMTWDVRRRFIFWFRRDGDVVAQVMSDTHAHPILGVRAKNGLIVSWDKEVIRLWPGDPPGRVATLPMKGSVIYDLVFCGEGLLARVRQLEKGQYVEKLWFIRNLLGETEAAWTDRGARLIAPFRDGAVAVRQDRGLSPKYVSTLRLTVVQADGESIYRIELETKAELIGIVETELGLVGWCADGSLHAFNAQGMERWVHRSLPRGHKGPVMNAVAGAGAIVSAGQDGAIKVWDFHRGDVEAAAPQLAHTNWITEIIAFDGVYLTATDNGAITRWETRPEATSWEHCAREFYNGGESTQNNPSDSIQSAGFTRVGPDIIAWSGWRLFHITSSKAVSIGRRDDSLNRAKYRGALAYKEDFVTWSGAALQIWGPSSVAHRATPHRRPIQGLVALTDERHLSWDRTGAIYAWDEALNLLSEEPLCQHGGLLDGVIRHYRGFVSWGDTALRYWNAKGEEIESMGSAHAHAHLIEGAIHAHDHIVTWGADGALKFWNFDGRQVEGRGSDFIHDGLIDTVIAWRGGFVSSGADGLVLLWSAEGKIADIIVPPGGVQAICVDEREDGVVRLASAGPYVWEYEIATAMSGVMGRQ